MSFSSVSRLSDAELLAAVKRLAGCQRRTAADLITHLAELETRQLHLSAGFPSLFAYCVRALCMSEDAAVNHIRAARAARRFPRILDMLADGSLSLTTARVLGPKLTAENHADLLDAASGKTRREVDRLLARWFPQPDVAATVRKLPAPKTPLPPESVSPPPTAVRWSPPASEAAFIAADPPSPPLGPTLPAVRQTLFQPPAVKPLSPDRYRVTFTASAETCEMLERAKELLWHAVPSGDTAEIMRRALQALLDELVRKKCAATKQPRPGRGLVQEGSRHIPAEVKRAVWIRDGGRCVFVGSTGIRCGERSGVEFHHVEAHAKGGPPTVENIQLRCWAHNAYEADLLFGPRRPGGEWAVHEMRIT
jgi:hypothetical protein